MTGKIEGELDVIYLTRPQVEKWTDDMLIMYSSSLESARDELKKRRAAKEKEEK